MTLELTSEQATALQDLIRAAQEVRTQGELFTDYRETDGGRAVILLPYAVWKRLTATVQAWEEKRGKE